MEATTTQPVAHTVKRTADVRPFLLLLSVAIIAADRLTKYLVGKNLQLGQYHTVIPGVFRISHVLNTGAAFSFMADSASPETVRVALIVFSLVAIAVVGFMLWKAGRVLTLTGVALALILGGAAGNLYDRLHYRHVIDFLEVHIVRYHWPDFNLADSAIVVGACLLILEIFLPHSADESIGTPNDASTSDGA